MELRPLGTSGLSVSAIALGTWQMAGTPDAWGEVDDRESIAAIHAAIDAGINLIDTAPAYGAGHAEEIVGNALHGRRHQVILATKCGSGGAGLRQGSSFRGPSRDGIRRECEASLRRLRTDFVDVYLCQWPDASSIRETVTGLVSLLEMGKIRAIGLANLSCEETTTAREYAPVHCVQARLSLLNRRAELDLLPYCREHSIGFLACSALEKGLLAGRFERGHEFEGLRARDPAFVGASFARNLRAIESLRPIAAAYSASLGQLAIQWTLSQAGVTAVTVGAKRASQVLENAQAAQLSIRAHDRLAITGAVQEAWGDA